MCAAYSHGAVIFNTLHAAAALAGVPLRDLVRDRHARLLWAAMIREGLEVKYNKTKWSGRGEGGGLCVLFSLSNIRTYTLFFLRSNILFVRNIYDIPGIHMLYAFPEYFFILFIISLTL